MGGRRTRISSPLSFWRGSAFASLPGLDFGHAGKRAYGSSTAARFSSSARCRPLTSTAEEEEDGSVEHGDDRTGGRSRRVLPQSADLKLTSPTGRRCRGLSAATPPSRPAAGYLPHQPPAAGAWAPTTTTTATSHFGSRFRNSLERIEPADPDAGQRGRDFTAGLLDRNLQDREGGCGGGTPARN